MYDPDDQNADGTYEPVDAVIAQHPELRRAVATLGDTYMVPTPEETNVLAVLSGGSPTTYDQLKYVAAHRAWPTSFELGPGHYVYRYVDGRIGDHHGRLECRDHRWRARGWLGRWARTDRRRHSSGATISSVDTATGVVTLSAPVTRSGFEELDAIDSSSLITDGTANSLNVTFDRPMQVSTFFTPVTLADILTSGSAVVGLGNTTGLEAGETVGGIGIPGPGPATPTTPPTTISDVLSVSFIGTLTDGSTTVTNLSTTTGLLAGEEVVGVGIPSGTTIRSVNHLASRIILSCAATSGSNGFLASGVTLSASATVSGTESLSTQGTSEVDQIMGPTGSLMGPAVFPIDQQHGPDHPRRHKRDRPRRGHIDSDHSELQRHVHDRRSQCRPHRRFLAGFGPYRDPDLAERNHSSHFVLGRRRQQRSGFMNTVFDDSADSSITTGTAPFTGTYQPAEFAVGL